MCYKLCVCVWGALLVLQELKVWSRGPDTHIWGSVDYDITSTVRSWLCGADRERSETDTCGEGCRSRKQLQVEGRMSPGPEGMTRFKCTGREKEYPIQEMWHGCKCRSVLCSSDCGKQWVDVGERRGKSLWLLWSRTSRAGLSAPQPLSMASVHAIMWYPVCFKLTFLFNIIGCSKVSQLKHVCWNILCAENGCRYLGLSHDHGA